MNDQPFYISSVPGQALSAAARSVLRIIGGSGARASMDEIAHSTGLSGEQLERAIDELVEKRVLTIPEAAL